MAVQQLGDEPKTLNVKLPTVVADAIKAAADANYETMQAWIRRTLIERLRSEGKLP